LGEGRVILTRDRLLAGRWHRDHALRAGTGDSEVSVAFATQGMVITALF
jgi:hypothetical protein